MLFPTVVFYTLIDYTCQVLLKSAIETKKTLFDFLFQSLIAVGTYEVQELKVIHTGCIEVGEEMVECNTTEYFWLTFENKTTGKN